VSGGADGDAPIRCRALTKRWGAVTGVEGLDLDVPAGEVTGFLGPNGAGKSTTIEMIAGLARPTSGEVLLWGRPAAEPAARARLGYMPADPAFYGPLSGEQNLDLMAALQGSGAPDRAWAAELLELDAADLRRPVREYSGGMVQKLGLVQAVQHRPELVVLDEPANRLDPLVHRRFERLVREIADDGRTVFLSSHTLSEVQHVCDSVAMVRTGRLLAHRPVAQLEGLESRRLRAVFAAGSGPPAPPPDGLTDARVEGAELTGRLAPGRIDVVRALAAREDLVDLTIEPATLEDAFVELYGDGA
jgi:ABC-2 type transport system ATP-binding protein